MHNKFQQHINSPESRLKTHQLPRSKLHNASTMDWLSKRYMQCAATKYLYLPEELHNHKEIMAIFQQFDEDKSGKLSIGELHAMMEKVHIAMDKKDLEEICKTVDLDHDNALNLNEFKNCALSEETDEHFKKIIKRLRQEYEEKLKKKKNDKTNIYHTGYKASKSKEHIHHYHYYTPHASHEDFTPKDFIERNNHREAPYFPGSFGALLNYITYKNKRKSLYNAINDSHLPLTVRVNTLKELLDTQIQTVSYMKKESKYKREFKILERSKSEIDLFNDSKLNERKKSDSYIQKINDSQYEDIMIPSLTNIMIKHPKRDINTHHSNFGGYVDSNSGNNGIGSSVQFVELDFMSKTEKKKPFKDEIDEGSNTQVDGNKKDKPRHKNQRIQSLAINPNMSPKMILSPEKEIKTLILNTKKLENDLLDTKGILKMQEVLNRAPVSPNNIQNNNANFLNEPTRIKVLDHLNKNKIQTNHEFEFEKDIRAHTVRSCRLTNSQYDQKDGEYLKKDFPKSTIWLSPKNNNEIEHIENQKTLNSCSEINQFSRLKTEEPSEIKKINNLISEMDILPMKRHGSMQTTAASPDKSLPKFHHPAFPDGISQNISEEEMLKSDKSSAKKFLTLDGLNTLTTNKQIIEGYSQTHRGLGINPVEILKNRAIHTPSPSSSIKFDKKYVINSQKKSSNENSKFKLPFVAMKQAKNIDFLTERDKYVLPNGEVLGIKINFQHTLKEGSKTQVSMKNKPRIKSKNPTKRKIIGNHPNFHFGAINKIQIRFPFFGQKEQNY